MEVMVPVVLDRSSFFGWKEISLRKKKRSHLAVSILLVTVHVQKRRRCSRL